MADKSYAVEYGNRCRQIRMAKGLSQQALAEKMNTTPQNVSKWERDGISNVDTVMQLSEVLGQDITADEIDQEGTVGEVGKEILSILIENRGYCEFSHLVNNMFGLHMDRVSNEIFKLERIGNVVREQYKDWLDQERDGVFITAKGIITIKNMEIFPNQNDIQLAESYEKRILSYKNFNDRIQKDEVGKLIWTLPDVHSSYRIGYIYYLMINFREKFPNQNEQDVWLKEELWNQELLPGENCYFDTLYFMAFGLENADFELNEEEMDKYYALDDEEDQIIRDEAEKEGANYIDWYTRKAQELFENMCPWIGEKLQENEKKNHEIEGMIEDSVERESDLMIRPSDYLRVSESSGKRVFEENVGSNNEKICDEWFTEEQISKYIEKNYRPAETDYEKHVDEIIAKINKLNPYTMEYYYGFPKSWEENGLAQKIRDVWNIPSCEDYDVITEEFDEEE